MARTFKQQPTRTVLPKFEGEYTGYKGEECYAQEGKAFIKKQVAKHSRRVAKREINKEIFNYD